MRVRHRISCIMQARCSGTIAVSANSVVVVSADSECPEYYGRTVRSDLRSPGFVQSFAFIFRLIEQEPSFRLRNRKSDSLNTTVLISISFRIFNKTHSLVNMCSTPKHLEITDVRLVTIPQGVSCSSLADVVVRFLR